MAKILLFSDLHVHPFKLYATLDSNGINSRLNDAFKCLDMIIDYAREHEVDLVLFGGDMFHVRKQLSVTAFNGVYECLRKLSEITNVVLLHGNHDQADRAGEQYSVYAFSSFIKVIDRPGWNKIHGVSGKWYNIFALPYQDELSVATLSSVIQQVPRSPHPRIFLGHLGINGALAGADFVYNSVYDANITDLHPELFDAGFLGHFHMYQDLGHNFFYIGAPIQHNWGDKNQERGIVVYDTDTKTHERVVLKLPMFWEIKYKGPYAHGQFKDSYVRIICEDGDIPNTEFYKQEWKARYVEAYKPKKKEHAPARMDVKVGMAITDALPTYVGLHKIEGLNEDYLLQLGRELLEEAEQE